MSNSHLKWSEFETVTKIGLEAIGYEVKKDRLIVGSQIDLYAEKTDLLQTHRLIVECKDYNKPIGVDYVRSLSAIVNAVSLPQRPIFGLLVSNEGFTKEAHAFADAINLKLLSLSELLCYSFNPQDICSYVIDNYNKNDLSEKYIDLSCQVTETRGSTIYKPVEKFFDKYFMETKRPGIALLGNFGSGKTSLCLHYAYMLAKRWKKEQCDSPVLLPIYINLRDFTDFLDLENNIYDFLRCTYKISLTKAGLYYWFVNKETILFLDGFDEMASKMDKLAINQNISSLIGFCNNTKVKIILSCRTHFLKSQVDEELLGTTLKLYLCNWGKGELVQYIQKSNPKQSPKLLNMIKKTYNLEELSKTPIFLNMIIQSAEEIGGKVSKSKLYEIYTDKWIHSQDYRAKLLPEDKKNFMEELAFKMYLSGHGAVKHERLPSYLKTHFTVQSYEFLLAVDNDIRTCSFLIRDMNGFYYFVHKSYMEFFVAKKLATEVKAHNYLSMEQVIITQEIADFFSDYFEKETDLIIRALLGNLPTNVRAGFALVIGFFEYKETHFDALKLCINTDESIAVKLNAIESLSKWGTSGCIDFMITLAVDDSEVASHSLRLLAGYIDNEKVLNTYIRILKNSNSIQKVKVVLEGVEQIDNIEISDVLFEFSKNKWWTRDVDIIKYLIKSIPNKDHLYLALELDNIEKNLPSFLPDDEKEELGSFIIAAKSEVISRFSSDIKKDAALNKQKGLSYSKNEGSLRRKYKFLIGTDKWLSDILASLYGVTVYKKDDSRLKNEKNLPRVSRRVKTPKRL